ncbi:hypothetical protein AGMMS49938_03270 [Fibrobacterales bacterium]|nr:hypothetical protein AGMMS49938_03270 [Fibrobacterales bacterium]
METLTDHLGMVEAERFVTLLLREPLDYTKWRQDLFKGVSLENFLKDAMNHRESMPK